MRAWRVIEKRLLHTYIYIIYSTYIYIIYSTYYIYNYTYIIYIYILLYITYYIDQTWPTSTASTWLDQTIWDTKTSAKVIPTHHPQFFYIQPTVSRGLEHSCHKKLVLFRVYLHLLEHLHLFDPLDGSGVPSMRKDGCNQM